MAVEMWGSWTDTWVAGFLSHGVGSRPPLPGLFLCILSEAHQDLL